MLKKVIVFDPTASDPLSKIRGIGRYLQILKENFSENWIFTSNLVSQQFNNETVFINPFFNFLQYPLIMKKIAGRQIAVIHDLIPLKYPDHFPIGLKGKLNVFLNKLALKNYDFIVTDSQTSKSDIIKILRIEPEKIKVIYPCLPKIFTEKSKILNHPFDKLRVLSLSKDKSQINSKRLEFRNSNLSFDFAQDAKLVEPFGTWNLEFDAFCLYVGDATWNKNLVNIAKAIKIANVKCVFVGKVFEILKRVQDDKVVGVASEERQNLMLLTNDWQKEFRQFLDETKDDKRFIFPGFIPDNQLIKLYEQAMVNILVSRDEGFGFSVIEAGLFGCPSVVSNIPVFQEIIGKDNALFINPNNPHQIAEEIKKISSDKKLGDEIGFKAQQRAKDYSQNKFKMEFSNIL